MNLSDEVIAHIAKLVQMAIITGTDVVDHLRQIKLKEENNQLELEEDYVTQSEQNVHKMLNEIKDMRF